MQAALGELDLLPLQVADLRCPQAMAVGHQDHGRVAMPVAAMLAGAGHQALDLALREVAPLDCQVYDVWCAFLGCRFHVDKLCLRLSYCIGFGLLFKRSITPLRSRLWPASAHFPWRVPVEEGAARKGAGRNEGKFSFPRGPPGGGGLWDFQKWVWPLLQKLGRKPFLKL